jgi:hypothetical protein
VTGFLAALWLLGLFVAAPALRTAARYSFVDRLRDALILGFAIPFLLGCIHALYPAACWLVLAAAAAIAYRRREPVEAHDAPIPYLLIASLALIAWPQLMRPMLDGDSLSYHLPNAASWLQAHTLLTAATRYWWYPPASELFATGLYAASGPFSLPWSGLGAITLLGFRIADWSRSQFALPPLLADALAAATVTAYPLAVQAGTLQNDAWLAAFWLETLWLIGRENAAAMRAVAVTALTKPQGWLFATLALIAARAPVKVWLAAAGAVAIWLLHDALGWRSAIVSPAATTYGSTFASSIVAHGASGLALLARVAVRTSPFALLALCAALLGPLIAPRARLGWAAFGAAAIFLVLPFGYASDVAQLASGASLRFAAPAIVVGALLLAHVARRAPVAGTTIFVLSALFGAALVYAIFWNDAPARAAPAIALIAIATVTLGRRVHRPWPIAVGLAATAIAANLLAASHPVDFYSDAFRVHGRSSGIYAWIETNRPPALGSWGLALGTVNVLSPTTRTVELPDNDSCLFARRERVLLVAVAESDRSSEFDARRLTAARRCGRVEYDDGIAVVAVPAE